MRVVYEEPVMGQVKAAIQDADATGRSIEKIVLTENEHRRLKDEMRSVCSVPENGKITVLLGVKIEVENQ